MPQKFVQKLNIRPFFSGIYEYTCVSNRVVDPGGFEPDPNLEEKKKRILILHNFDLIKSPFTFFLTT